MLSTTPSVQSPRAWWKNVADAVIQARLTQVMLATVVNPRTQKEIDEDVEPVNYWYRFPHAARYYVDDWAEAIQTALDLGTNGGVHTVELLDGSITVPAGLLWPTAYKCGLRAPNLAVLNFSHTDGADCIACEDWASDAYRPYLDNLKIVGSADTGHGLSFVRASDGAGPEFNNVEVRACSGTGKAGIYSERNFIAIGERVSVFNCTIGIRLVNSSGWKIRDGWVADNGTNVVQDASCSGNVLELTELGLSSINTARKAIEDAGHNNVYVLSFYENFTAAQSIWFKSTSYANEVRILAGGPVFVYDDGRSNTYPASDALPLSNQLVRHPGPHWGQGRGVNLYCNSSFETGATIGNWLDYSSTPPTKAHDAAEGYFDLNSMELDWGTTALSGVEDQDANRQFAVTVGDELWCMHFIKASRDMAANETFQFKVFGAAGQNRWVHYIAGLKAGVWTPVVMRYPVTVTENVHLAISMLLDSGSTHSAIVTNHDDFVVMKNTPLTPVVNSSATVARTLSGYDLYSPRIAAEHVFAARQIRVGVAPSASTPGTVVRRLEVFDVDGTSLGYMPIYDSIS